mgnify:CR=1 FL=1
MKTMIRNAVVALGLLSMVGCATTHIKPYERKTRDYMMDDYASPDAGRTTGSLWSHASAGMFEDMRARRIGDIITVKIMEAANATRDASTSTSRDSSQAYGVSSFFGALGKITAANPDLNLEDLLSATASSSFDGSGTTARSGRLDATLPTRIKKTLPNGDFYIEGTKVVLINEEESILYLSGVIRPVDIQPDNSVSSLQVADVELEYTGRGVIADKQSPGWFSRVMDWVWPF